MRADGEKHVWQSFSSAPLLPCPALFLTDAWSSAAYGRQQVVTQTTLAARSGSRNWLVHTPMHTTNHTTTK